MAGRSGQLRRRSRNNCMQATIEETGIIQKTKDLCQTLVEQPEFQQIRRSIDAFMADEQAKNQYQLVMEKGDLLQHRQNSGQPLDNAEITDFETNREVLLNNALARDFLEAQQQMHKIQESVMQYVGKTFELGRVPTTEDFSSGGCGPSCGCGH
jgi:cell fate (sporulation/competence/biofilm development) regulator YlbF (YheA/YmcA/DUF963 family)